MDDRRRVLHIITGLEVGGTETALYRLLEYLDRDRFDCRVFALKGDGPLGDKMRSLGIEVECFGIDRNPLRWFRLARRIHTVQPHVVQTWLYHADFLGGLAARIAGFPELIWSVRHADLDPARNERSVLYLVRLLAAFSRWMPRRILFNSVAARDVHTAIGYATGEMLTIPNGFDTAQFRPDPTARERLVGELQLPKGAPLVGLAARFHAQKDHETFLDAAAKMKRHAPDLRFVLCGRDVDAKNPVLRDWVDRRGLHDSVHLLGARDDMPRILAALDIAVSSSFGEAFPNAVGEAMACGVPCVVTDVGDSARLVGSCGRVVARRDPEALADSCLELLGLTTEQRRSLGRSARERVVERYSLPEVVRRFGELWEAGVRP